MIIVQDLTKSFGKNTVLNKISLRLSPGERLFVVGKSGVGKSVLLKTLIGLLSADGGEIFIDDENVSNYDEKAWTPVRAKFGFVFQGAALFDSLTILENVALRRQEVERKRAKFFREEVAAALARVGLSADVLDKLPADLSGGMRKRAAVARALFHRPRYLLYDEPTTGLDPVTAARLDELVLEVSVTQNVGTLVVSHDIESVRNIATSVLFLHEGNALFYGIKKDFFATNEPLLKSFIHRLAE